MGKADRFRGEIRNRKAPKIQYRVQGTISLSGKGKYRGELETTPPLPLLFNFQDLSLCVANAWKLRFIDMTRNLENGETVSFSFYAKLDKLA
jgi:hypothetical protein